MTQDPERGDARRREPVFKLWSSFSAGSSLFLMLGTSVFLFCDDRVSRQHDYLSLPAKSGVWRSARQMGTVDPRRHFLIVLMQVALPVFLFCDDHVKNPNMGVWAVFKKTEDNQNSQVPTL
jgi:hypothetical protein